MYNRRAFKWQAKAAMRGAKPHFMVVALVYWLLSSGLSLVVSLLSGGGGDLMTMVAGFFQIILMVFNMVFSVGFAAYALRLSRGQEADAHSLFSAFPFAGRAISANIQVLFYTCLWAFLAMFAVGVLVIPAAALLMNAIASEWILYAAGGVLYLISFALTYLISLRYSMVSFALVDDPESGAGAAVRRSVQIMRRNKGKYFVLLLSFVGWFLLIGLISGAVQAAGFLASDTEWVYDAFALVGDDITELFTIIDALSNQLWLWSLLAELVTLPLTLWLSVYMQTSYARFYNHVSGYDYFMRTQAEAVEKQTTPSFAQSVYKGESKSGTQTSAQSPAGGFYNRVPDLSAPPEEVPAEEVPVEEDELEDDVTEI